MILDAIAVPVAAAGVASLYWAATSLGPYRQVLRRESRPVRDVAAGPVEVVGTLKAVDAALTSIDGTAAIAIRTVVSYTYVIKNRRSRASNVIDEVEAVGAEIRDDSGGCRIDAVPLLLLGEIRSLSLSPAEFAARCKGLAHRLVATNVSRFDVEQTIIPDGAAGLVSGEADPIEDGGDAGEGYRGEARRRFRLTSTAERPLIVSAFAEARTRAILLRPAWLFASLAFAWFAIAATLVGAARFLGG